MRLHRFYITEEVKNKTEIEISDSRIVHQVRNVFRLDTGGKVIVFDGSGSDFECEIMGSSQKSLKLKVIKSKESIMPTKKVALFMSVIKKELFELVCEKATELGVTEIVPVVTERTMQKNLNRERIGKILIEASEQCGRGNLPTLGDEMKLEKVLEQDNLIVCDMGGESFKSSKPEAQSLQLLIGPEGGWTESERNLFKEKKLKTVSLGETVLRAETAAIVAVYEALL